MDLEYLINDQIKKINKVEKFLDGAKPTINGLMHIVLEFKKEKYYLKKDYFIVKKILINKK